jgi:hypothetical protein
MQPEGKRTLANKIGGSPRNSNRFFRSRTNKYLPKQPLWTLKGRTSTALSRGMNFHIEREREASE